MNIEVIFYVNQIGYLCSSMAKSSSWALDQLLITNYELGEETEIRTRGNHRFNQLPITNYELGEKSISSMLCMGE